MCLCCKRRCNAHDNTWRFVLRQHQSSRKVHKMWFESRSTRQAHMQKRGKPNGNTNRAAERNFRKVQGLPKRTCRVNRARCIQGWLHPCSANNGRSDGRVRNGGWHMKKLIILLLCCGVLVSMVGVVE